MENFKNLPTKEKIQNYEMYDTLVGDLLPEILGNSPQEKVKFRKNFFGVDDGVLSKKEIEDFELFVGHTIKRILLADLEKKNINSKNEAVENIENIVFNALNLLRHDISHSISSYKTNKDQGLENVTPLFHKTKTEDEINNKELIKEELFALLWMNPFRGSPIPLSLLDLSLQKEFLKNLKTFLEDIDRGDLFLDIEEKIKSFKDDNFEDFLKLYQDVILTIVSMPNDNYILDKSKGDIQSINFLKDEFEQIVKELKDNPDKDLVSLLKNIYENKNNPKILYEEFYKICEPLILKIRKRKKI